MWALNSCEALPSFDRSKTRVGGSLPCSRGRGKRCHHSLAGLDLLWVAAWRRWLSQDVTGTGGTVTGHGSVYGWVGVPSRYLFFCLTVHTVGLSWLPQQP